MPILVGFDPTSIHTVEKFTLGALYEQGGIIYRYVKFVDAIAYIAGHVCLMASATQWDVTNDVAGGASIATAGAVVNAVGVAMAVMTEDSFGFMAVDGIVSVSTDASVAIGENLVPHTVNGQSDTMAAGEEHLVFGQALTADVANLVPARIFCL